MAGVFSLRRGPRRSLGTTIFACFIAMGLITAALGEHGLIVLSAAGRFVADTYDRTLMAVSYARSASLDFSRMEAELLRRRIADPSERPAIDLKIDKLAASLHDDLEVVDERSRVPDEKKVINEIRDLVVRWGKLRDAGDNAAAERDALGGKIIERLDALIEVTNDHGFIARRVAMTNVDFYTYSSYGAIVLALLLSAATTILLTRRIMGPLGAAAAVADRIANGELDTQIPHAGEDETGALLRSMKVMQDNIRVMVEREQAQRRSAQNRLVDALESSREAIVLVDAEGKIIIANSQLARFFPAIAPQLKVGMSFADAMGRVGELAVAGGLIHAAGSAGEPEGEGLSAGGSEFRLSDGRWLWASRTATRDGGFFLLISDISDLKEREGRLDEARRAAEAASEAKGAFLAAMSHELRTPLNAVIGFSEMLSGQIFGVLGHVKYVEYAESIQHSGRHLLGIINNVLDLSKHQAGKVELALELVDVAQIVQRCAAIMRDQCARAELRLTIEVPNALIIRGDAGRLQQMLLNLLSNAVKFTNPGGSVGMIAQVAADGRIKLQVVDTGIGMSAEQIPIALAVFGQVDSRLERRYGGTGLGLPLAKAIVELHGGEIAIDSAPGHGTTVTVWLPQQAETASPRPAAAVTPLERVA